MPSYSSPFSFLSTLTTPPCYYADTHNATLHY